MPHDFHTNADPYLTVPFSFQCHPQSFINLPKFYYAQLIFGKGLVRFGKVAMVRFGKVLKKNSQFSVSPIHRMAKSVFQSCVCLSVCLYPHAKEQGIFKKTLTFLGAKENFIF